MIRKLIFNQYFSSFFLGAISALAFAPSYFIFLAVIGFTGLFLLIHNQKNFKRSFLLGWFFGFGHFVVGLYWISISLFVDIKQFFWLLPFSITLIPAAAAVYIGLTTALTNKISDFLKFTKFQKILLFTLIWICFEFLRSILFSGFPWNLIGYSLTFSTNISQFAAISGIYGLSILALLIYTLPAILFDRIYDNDKNKEEWCGLDLNINSKTNFYIIISFVILIIGICSYGKYHIKDDLKLAKNGKMRLIQPNIEQTLKWDPVHKRNSFLKNLRLATQNDNKDINYVILSESAIPYLIDKNSVELLNILKSAIPKNAFLISGVLRKEIAKNSKKKYFNSIVTINDEGKIIDFYDKRHLVPFGEYIPFQKYVPFISKITHGSEGFSEGKEQHIVNPKKDFPTFNPLICYEVIFSNLANSDKRPDFLLNVTNDAWFGKSSGPFQHLAMSQIRAIEYGMPLIRVANNGVSAYIDPYGRIINKINLNKTGIIDIKLVEKLKTTFYAEHSKTPPAPPAPLILMITLLIIGILKNVFQNKSFGSTFSQKAKRDP